MAPPHNYQICNFSPLRMKKEFCAIFHLRELVFPRDKEMLLVLPSVCNLLLAANVGGISISTTQPPPLTTTTNGNQ